MRGCRRRRACPGFPWCLSKGEEHLSKEPEPKNQKMAEALAQNVSRRILVSDCMILVWLWMRVCERSARDVRARRVRRNSREASDSSGKWFLVHAF